MTDGYASSSAAMQKPKAVAQARTTPISNKPMIASLSICEAGTASGLPLFRHMSGEPERSQPRHAIRAHRPTEVAPDRR
ncbi:hypothetical protein [Bosea sp. (in: a-proteobacteria)]|uniref:hypothetical protein n=1 Tax=Bosea sp. (in: a-proteobacteria) TaxID=1871050 RepID=UPI003F7B788B